MVKRSHTTLWLALAGPGILAGLSLVATQRFGSDIATPAFLLAFAGLVALVFTRARRVEGLSSARLGIRPPKLFSPILVIALSAFFILLFGPFAVWLLNALGLGTFDAGINRLHAVPTLILVLNILVVAGGEEWLYRCYAVERLSDLTGNVWLAGLISVLAFAVVHVPFWGPGTAFTTLISGGILTLAYIATRDIAALIVAHVLVDLYGLMPSA